MKIAIVGPSPVPFTRGGAERALWGIHDAINNLTHHDGEVIKLPVNESTLPGIVEAYEQFSKLDLSHFDQVITAKYPAWMVEHERKTILMFHVLRGLYDTYHLTGQPLVVDRPSDPVFAMMHLMRTNPAHRGALPEFFERFSNALKELGAGHRDLEFPGPFARLVVHWLDGIGMSPSEVAQYMAISKTVARRSGYFPPAVTPKIVYLPGELPATGTSDVELPEQSQRPDHPLDNYLFTVSRLDGPKRIDLLIEAMGYVSNDVDLRIAGTGPLREDLEQQASDNPRIKFLGFTADEDLPGLYRDALAVPFIPQDEDLGLITLEAFSQATPVITCTDSGGPTEFVRDGVTGLVAEPNAASLGTAIQRLVDDQDLGVAMGLAGQERGAKVTWEQLLVDLLGDDRFTDEDRQRSAKKAATVQAERPRSPHRIVVLTTFAINDPGHGGQLRARNLYGELARYRPVEIVALVEDPSAAGFLQIDENLTQLTVARSREHHAMGQEKSAEAGLPVTDLVAGTDISLTPAYLDAVRSSAEGASAVLLAEPYLVSVVEELGLDLPVLYDAYNVEATLKAEAFPQSNIGRELLNQVVDFEKRALQRCALITACSKQDADELAQIAGLEAGSVVVIPNGTTVGIEKPDFAKRSELSKRWRHHRWLSGSSKPERKHIAVFFGSWHPPNLD
ncbi:MAG: glycosyltransferase, partial [Acidimicrobiales bacterium]|nr:glycosyltransferase [Acidimicrobiales bacterium]